MTQVNRVDLESKLREIEGVVTDVEDEVRSNAIKYAAVAGLVVVAATAFVVWRSRWSKIRVEVYKQ